jgi:hypothetical protein
MKVSFQGRALPGSVRTEALRDGRYCTGEFRAGWPVSIARRRGLAHVHRVNPAAGRQQALPVLM